MNNYKKVFALMTLLALQGCEKKPPNCSDPTTQRTLKEIITKNYSNNPMVSKSYFLKNIEFELTRPISYDKEIKKINCESNVVTGGRFKFSINYDSQIDENNNHIVIINNLTDLEALNSELSIIAKFKSENKDHNISSEESVSECVERSIKEYRKEMGEDAMIKFDLLEDMEANCANN